jgi:hypothetical protein
MKLLGTPYLPQGLHWLPKLRHEAQVAPAAAQSPATTPDGHAAPALPAGAAAVLHAGPPALRAAVGSQVGEQRGG